MPARARRARSATAVLTLLLSVAMAFGTGAAAPAAAEQSTPPAASPAVAPTPGPSVPQTLNGHRHARSCPLRQAAQASCSIIVDLDVSGALASPHTAPSGYAPADLQAAYSLPSATGGFGSTVAVVDAYDAPTAAADLAVYRSQFGLPPCGSGCFTKVNQTGGSTMPAVNAGWAAEIALDLDMVSAACPNCHILLVEANSASLSDLGTAVNTAVRMGATAVSNSYGSPEFASESAFDVYYNHPGVTVTASSGDSSYGVVYPAASPYVTAVGGTRLTRNSTSGAWQETAWSGAGSGCSAYEPKPSWQNDAGCSKRTVTDLSAVADPGTGVAFYNSTPDNGLSGWLVGGGTSVSAPLIAAASTLAAEQAPTSYPVQQAYTVTGGSTDVVSGSNGTCSPSYLCTAGVGYDGPTGMGSPSGTSALAPPALIGTSPGTFTPLAPYRQLDTRDGTGGVSGAVAPGATVRITVTGHGGIPANGVSAVALNVTVTQPTNAGNIAVYAGDKIDKPSTSNLNFTPGQTIPNLVIAPVSSDGRIALTNNSTGTVHLIADTFGYYLSGTPTLPGTYTSMDPYRLLDTRDGTGGVSGAVAPGATVRISVTKPGGIPADGVSAVAVNVTVTQPSNAGNIAVYADGTPLPTTSNLNFTPGQTIPNLVIVPVGDDGKIALTNNSTGTVHLIADAFGYYLSGRPSDPGAFTAAAPYRQLDTRDGTGGVSGPVAPGATIRVAVAGHGGIPSGVSAVVVNVTVTQPGNAGNIAVYASRRSKPSTSNLNFAPGQTIPNLVIAPVGSDGMIALTNNSTGTVQLIADTFGYY